MVGSAIWGIIYIVYIVLLQKMAIHSFIWKQLLGGTLTQASLNGWWSTSIVSFIDCSFILESTICLQPPVSGWQSFFNEKYLGLYVLKYPNPVCLLYNYSHFFLLPNEDGHSIDKNLNNLFNTFPMLERKMTTLYPNMPISLFLPIWQVSHHLQQTMDIINIHSLSCTVIHLG